MNQARLADRLVERSARLNLPHDPRIIARLTTYFDLLRRWNRKINLTALALEPASDEAIDRLLLEPLVAARLLRSRATLLPNADSSNESGGWFDLGSGGGSPAIPMKVALAALPLTMAVR